MTVEDEVRAVARAFVAALLTNEAPRVAAFMTDDWVYVDRTGAVPKADVVGAIAAGRLVHETMTVVGADRVVRAGDAVIVTARKASSGRSEGRAYTADEWITEVYVRADDGWRCAFSQKTDVAAPAA
jgi:uncharacterized protein (TIGR02246 family)